MPEWNRGGIVPPSATHDFTGMGNKRPHPYRCPVCEGRGTVGAGFYSGPAATGVNSIECRSCSGSGVLWR